jgi:hypothetical protein
MIRIVPIIIGTRTTTLQASDFGAMGRCTKGAISSPVSHGPWRIRAGGPHLPRGQSL